MIKIMDEKCDNGHDIYLTSEKKTGTGLFILIIGLFLAPAIIGIPILIWGIKSMNKEVHCIFCPTCGARCEVTDEQFYYLLSNGGYIYQ